MLYWTNKEYRIVKITRTGVPLAFPLKSIHRIIKQPHIPYRSFRFWAIVLYICSIQIYYLSAQNTIVDRKTKQIPADFFKDETNELTIDDILEDPSSFTPLSEIPIDDLNATYWIRLDFIDALDTLKQEFNWTLRTAYYSEAQLFYNKNGAIMDKPFGKFNSPKPRTSFRYNNGVNFSIDNLIDNRYLFVKVNSFLFTREMTFEYLSNKSNRFFTNYYTHEDLKEISFHQVFLGACVTFFFTFLIIFFKVQKMEFLFYSLYVMFLGIYLGGAYISITFTDTMFGFWTILISQVFINLFYVLFAIYFLNTKVNYPKLHVLLISVVPILIAIIAADSIAFIIEDYMIKHWILTFQRLLMTMVGVFSMIYLLLKAKDHLTHFIVVGSFCYMLGALGLLFFHSRYYMTIGASIEILLFSLGLAYKIKKEYESKLNLQAQLSLKEIIALRSQINPHFIFNSLSSIQHLIIQNDKMSALNYLSKFSKLTRNVLESSHLTTVTLDEEIDVIKSYLELESLRFDNSFQYTIDVAENLDVENVNIPLMLVQPFVENALIHGLIGKKNGEKKLHIRFYNEGEHCVIEVEDNGIGRLSIKNKNYNQKSRGMEITQKRLQMLNNSAHNKSSIEIIDKYDDHGLPSGTKVILKIHNP
ncbi:histidine kinase [Allomuricauda sp.]|uniref:sensor histidine kinase n=1 Tax=Flagellimonas alginolytica TaxID=3177515 RepID=UPI0025D37A2C|nr:histidine kinase [Allomuricauda sp.]